MASTLSPVDVPFQKRLLCAVIATVIRAVGATLRFRVEDRANILTNPPNHPVIWAFWHNRVFSAPVVYEKFLSSRGGSVLTSPSGDGEMIAQVMEKFGIGAVRGSSSRQGARALKALAKVIRDGGDVVITPDGPRGPRYELGPGLIKLAQLTAAPIFPVHIRYDRAWTLKTWDGFRIPFPFSRVDVVFDAFYPISKTEDAEAFEAERIRLQSLLREGTGEEQKRGKMGNDL